MATAPDPFDALGLPARFDLARDLIERHYLARVACAHPDASPGSPDAALSAAALNDARATLADPERRAAALLQRLGGPPAEQDKTLPPGFLAEMMEARSEMEGDLESGDPATRDRWRAWASARRAALIADVAAAFAGAPGADLPAVRRLLNAWRYVERTLEQLEERPR